MSILHNTIIHFVSDRNNNKIYIRIMVEIIVNVVFPGCLNKFNNPSNKLVQTGLT